MAKRTAGAKALQRGSVWCVREAESQRGSRSRVNRGEGWHLTGQQVGREGPHRA